MAEKKTSIIYARVSSAKQADDGLPIDSQIEQAHKKADGLGSTVLKVFTDAGISGRTDDRPAFQDAVNYCKSFTVDYFICWSTSRFARNKIDAALYKRELERIGCRVVYVSVDVDNRTDAGWMLESFLEIFDEHYSRQVSTDTRRSMLKNARDGFYNGGRVPLGYKTYQDGKRKRIMIDEDEAPLIREIFQSYIEGNGAKVIAMNLNERGLLNRGRKWQKTTITWLLKNHVYIGETVFNRVDKATRKERPQDEWIITKSHDAIIDEEVFMATQEMMGKRRPVIGSGSARSGHVFTGMLLCGECNGPMKIETASGRSSRYAYYNCSTSLRGKGCSVRRIPADDFDEYMIDFIMEQIFSQEQLTEMVRDLQQSSNSWIKERAKRREALNSEMRSIETRLRNLYSLLELHGKNAPNLADLTDRLRELKDERGHLEQQLVNLEQQPIPDSYLTDYDVPAMFELLHEVVMSSTDPKKLRSFFGVFIKSIVLKDRAALVEWHPEQLLNQVTRITVHSMEDWLPVLVLLRTKFIDAPLPQRFIRRPSLAA